MAIQIFGNRGGKTGFVDVFFDLGAFARFVRINPLLIDVVCVYFVTIFGQNGRVGQTHKSSSYNDYFHIYSL